MWEGCQRCLCCPFGVFGLYVCNNFDRWHDWISGEVKSQQTHLQYAQLDFVNRDLCRNLTEHRINRKWTNGLADSQFCAGVLQGGIDSCQVKGSFPL
jgi:hypothetical protein